MTLRRSRRDRPTPAQHHISSATTVADTSASTTRVMHLTASCCRLLTYSHSGSIQSGEPIAELAAVGRSAGEKARASSSTRISLRRPPAVGLIGSSAASPVRQRRGGRRTHDGGRPLSNARQRGRQLVDIAGRPRHLPEDPPLAARRPPSCPRRPSNQLRSGEAKSASPGCLRRRSECSRALTSRWTMPCWWATARASSMWIPTIQSAQGSAVCPAAANGFSEPPEHSFITSMDARPP